MGAETKTSGGLEHAKPTRAVPDAQAAASTADYEFEDPPRPWWRGDWNIWFLLGLVLVFWFITSGAAVFFSTGEHRDWYFDGHDINPWSAVHVVAASIFALMCAANVFHTPSHGPLYRTVHVTMGRVAMVLGLVSVTAGFVALFQQGYSQGFKIGLSVAGAAQIFLQALGMYSMYKPVRNISMHAGCMHGLIMGAALGAASNRFPVMLGLNLGSMWPAYAWATILPLLGLSVWAFVRSRWI